jgi:hypothetical protein
MKQGACYGCGVALQTDDVSVSGFVPEEEYETKRQHRQLYGMMLCARCSELSHGRMVNAVAGQGGARQSKVGGCLYKSTLEPINPINPGTRRARSRGAPRGGR